MATLQRNKGESHSKWEWGTHEHSECRVESTMAGEQKQQSLHAPGCKEQRGHKKRLQKYLQRQKMTEEA